MTYEIHDFSEYLLAPAKDYYDWLVQAKEIGSHPELGVVVPAMRKLIPLPEDTYPEYRESRKILHKGKHVAAHSHIEWVALFYVDLGEPPLPVFIDSVEVMPKAGDCVVIPPNVPHHTELSESPRPRILTALLVDPRQNDEAKSKT